MHLNLEVDGAAIERELARLAALGVTVLDRRDDWVVLADPEGNEFCIDPV